MRGLILSITALSISTGCVGLPGPETFDPAYGNKPKDNVRTLLGEPGSGKPVRAGQTRVQLHNTLGTPVWRSADKSIESYFYHRHYGFVFCLIPMGHLWGDQTNYDYFYLVLRYDPEDRLSSWEFGEEIVESGNMVPTNRSDVNTGKTKLFQVDHAKGWPATEPF